MCLMGQEQGLSKAVCLERVYKSGISDYFAKRKGSLALVRGGWETDFSFRAPPPPAFLLRIETVASSKVQEDAARVDEIAQSSSKVCEV